MRFRAALDDGEHGVAAREIDIADIGQSCGPRLGMLLTAPGKTSQTPTVPTVSIAPVALAAASTASAISAAARNASRRSGISTAPAWPPSPSISISQGGGRGDGGDDAERDAGAFQQRTLLDVQFDEGVIVAGGQRAPTPADRRSRRRREPHRGLRHRASLSAAARAGSSVPESRRLPRQPMPKRVGSSEVKRISSMERRGRKPARCSARIASSAPSTPTVPS